MNPFRVRIRTMMILIALIAVLIGVIAASGLVRRIRDVSVRIEQSSLWVRFELVPESSPRDGSGSIIFSHSLFVQIPLMTILILATIATALIALAAHLPARRKRRAELRRSPGPAEGPRA
jgi:hypothetical protein